MTIKKMPTLTISAADNGWIILTEDGAVLFESPREARRYIDDWQRKVREDER